MVLLSLLKKLTKIVIKSPINSAYARSQGASETEFLQSNNVCPIILGNSMSSRQFRIIVLPQAVRRRRGVAAASALTSGPGGRSQSTVPGSGGRPTVDCGGTYAPVEGRGTLEGAGGRKLHAARRSAGGGSPW